ncbi:MAG: STAS domain-containing protein, partial [Beijerinckiaceae bacterium]
AIMLGERPSAAEVKYMILKAVEASQVVRLDASQVEKISMASIQIILAAHKQIATDGGVIIVRNATFFFLNAFESLGYLGNREIFQLEYV